MMTSGPNLDAIRPDVQRPHLGDDGRELAPISPLEIVVERSAWKFSGSPFSPVKAFPAAWHRSLLGEDTVAVLARELASLLERRRLGAEFMGIGHTEIDDPLSGGGFVDMNRDGRNRDLPGPIELPSLRGEILSHAVHAFVNPSKRWRSCSIARLASAS